LHLAAVSLAPSSLPTLRSSDLLDPRQAARAARREGLVVADLFPERERVAEHEDARRARRLRDRVLLHAARAARVRADACAAGFEDRKSTRLNSSHVKISYAVFC